MTGVIVVYALNDNHAAGRFFRDQWKVAGT